MNKSILIKVATWRVLCIALGTLLSWLLIGEFQKSLEITLIFTGFFAFIHYWFELAWSKWIDKK
jgi:uncharacterized membrane protein